MGQSTTDSITGARLTQRRRLTWAETDAAGHHHFSAAVRWLEEAEHELWRRLGLVELVPQVPRVHVEVDYRERIWFDQELLVTVGVVSVGRTSCHFAFDVRDTEGVVAVEGRHSVVNAPDPSAGARPWSAEVRSVLEDTSIAFE